MTPKFPEINLAVYSVLSSDFYPRGISPRVPDGKTQIGWHLQSTMLDDDGNLLIESVGYGDDIDDYVWSNQPAPPYGPIHVDDVDWDPVVTDAMKRWFASL